MKQIRVSDAARLDRIEIWLHIANDNPGAADNLIEEFDESLWMLAESPGLGRLRPELGLEVRYFPVANYLIFYQEVPDGIRVLRIIHGARRLEGLI
jgi:toxin ParE1/3/4